MQNRIVLISDDTDFFAYVSEKLMLRRSDELFKFSFDELPEKLHLLSDSLLIVNSENSQDRTLELMEIAKDIPVLVFAYNENEDLKIKTCKSGALGFLTPFTTEEEFNALIKVALKIASSLRKNKQYREILVNSNQISETNEVFLDYTSILDRELSKSNTNPSVLVAISPNDKTKFLLQANLIETAILNNIRKNDILMNYASNKYFLLLFDIDISSAEKIWEKIKQNIPEKIYAGFANTASKSRQQLINEVLNKLHEAINYDKDSTNIAANIQLTSSNFKTYKKEFYKKISQIITPVFYQNQQKYNDKLFGLTILQEIQEDSANFYIKGRNCCARMFITWPGLAKINIDISYPTNTSIPQKRVSFEPNQFEAGILEDLLEQFIKDFNKEINNDNS